MRSPSLLWIPTKLTSSPTSSYSTFISVSISLQLSLGSPSTAPFAFRKHVSSLKANFFPRLKAFRCISASSWDPSKQRLSLLYKAFLPSHKCFTRMVSIFLALPTLPNRNAFTERLSLAASRPPLTHFSSLRHLYHPTSHPHSFRPVIS